MSVTHIDAVRTTICDFIVDKVDVSTPGDLVFRLSGTAASPGTEVARIVLAAAAFGGAVAGVATLLGVPLSDTSATGHASPVANATLEDGVGSVVAHCSVGTAGEDINMSSLVIAADDTVTITALTYTAPV
jgi:hypothetical protein